MFDIRMRKNVFSSAGILKKAAGISEAILEKYKDVQFENNMALPVISNQKMNISRSWASLPR